jgi:integrase
MASIRRRTTKAGADFYEIRVRVSRDRPELSTRWYVPDDWSQKAIDREVAKVAAEFERQCKAGEVLSRNEHKAQAEQEALERAKIKTLQQYTQQVFVPQKTVTAATRTVTSYRWTFEKYVFPALGNFLMQDVTATQITALLLGLQDQGLAHSSVVRVYTILNGLFKSALLDDTIIVNPMDKVQRPHPRKDEVKTTEPEIFTEQEVVHLLNCLQEAPLKWRVFISLLVETGIRRGEGCGLQWKNVDLKNNQITVAGGVIYTPETGVLPDTTKGKAVRTIPISAGMASLLRSMRAEQKIVSTWVFPMADNPTLPMHPDTPSKYFSAFGKRHGIENLHPHKLRHTFASIGLTNGADVVSISELLGHADTSVSLRVYSHATAESRKRAVDIFQNAIQEASTKKA